MSAEEDLQLETLVKITGLTKQDHIIQRLMCRDVVAQSTYQGTSLCLAVEDDFQRIQSRMFMMYGVNDTPNLHFATAAGKSGTV